MEIDYCNVCSDLVVLYEECDEPLRWCNRYRKHMSNVKRCDSKYKNKDP